MKRSGCITLITGVLHHTLGQGVAASHPGTRSGSITPWDREWLHHTPGKGSGCITLKTGVLHHTMEEVLNCRKAWDRVHHTMGQGVLHHCGKGCGKYLLILAAAFHSVTVDLLAADVLANCKQRRIGQ